MPNPADFLYMLLQVVLGGLAFFGQGLNEMTGAVSGQRVTDNKDVNKAQDDVGNTAGGLVGKGGVAQEGGDTLSKGL